MVKLILLSLFVTFSLSQTLHAKIYKWTDSEGKVHYSATPPKDANTKAENIEDKIKLSVGKAQPITTHHVVTKTPEEPIEELAVRQNSAQDEINKSESKAKMAYCNGLRHNIHTLESSKKVNIAEEGVLKPLDSKQHKERLSKEKSNLEKNCSTV